MSASTHAFTDNSADPHVRGFLHTPETPNGSALVLSHGAGSNANAPLLIALAATFSGAGFTVLRCDLPYRQSRSYGPPGPGDAARDRAGIRNAIAAIRKTITDGVGDGQKNEVAPSLSRPLRQGGDFQKNEVGAPSLASFAKGGNSDPHPRIFLGGHSYGGRQSSMLCAEDPDLANGLLLLSYPLHPPRKPEQQRTQHLPDLRTPTLFAHGTRDPFGTIAELEQAVKMIPAKTKLLTVEGAGHDLGFKGKTRQEGLPAIVLAAFQDFFS